MIAFTLTICVVTSLSAPCEKLTVQTYPNEDDCEAAKVLYISAPATAWAECEPTATATQDFEVTP